ncbi:MAG TPA: ABC transporter permease, partial [Terriglobales bacterium]|nr:ABC transporter permease [Terriglobales bacterium]
LGIGANTAIFTVIDAVMLRMLPVDHPEQLVAIGDASRVGSWSNGTPRTDSLSYPLYREIRDHNQSFSSVMAALRPEQMEMAIDGGGAEKAGGRIVTGDYFQTLGVQPLIGRTFTGDEDRVPGGDPYLVISYGYWQRRFSGDPSVIGRTVRVRNFPFTIIGVAPPSFFGDVVGSRPDFWAPMMMEPTLMPGRDFLETPNTSALLLIGRLKPGVTLAQAREDVNAIVRRALTETLAARLSADDRDAISKGLVKLQVPVTPGGHGLSRLRAEFSAPLLLLMGMVALVLLVACVNVANLLLARSTLRQREIAVRLAIGAAPGRVVRQLLTESILLATVGGAMGIVFAQWGAAALVDLTNRRGSLTSPLVLGIDWRVLAFTAVVCLVAAVVFGLLPALRFRKVNLAPALKEGGRDAAGGARKNRAGRVLISSQIALAVLVLMAAGLLVRSLRNLQDSDLGYSRDRLLLARVDPIASGYKTNAAALEVDRQVLERLKSLPGVKAATMSVNGLYSGTESADAFTIEGFTPGKQEDSIAYDDDIGPDYFSTIGVPIILGREINQQDYASAARVAVVNETFAKFYFGGRNPIGHKVTLQDSDHPNAPPFDIIGVCKDVRDHSIRAAVDRRIYIPLTTEQFAARQAPNYEVRAVGNPAALVNEVRKAILDLDPNLVVNNVSTADELVEDTLTTQILVARLSSFFGLLVLALICVGLYGTMSYSVVGRTREIGVRMALGARRPAVIWMVAREACIMLAVGIAVGIPLGIATSTAFKAMLFDVSKADPLSIAAAVLTLIVIAIAAAVIPARRATHVDPMVALRYE